MDLRRHSRSSEHGSLTFDAICDETKANNVVQDVEPVQNGKAVVNADRNVCPKNISGSWSIAIVIASFLSCSIVGCMFISFSILYMSFVEHFNAESAATGWIGSLFLAAGNILGIIFCVFIKFYGCRLVAVVGGFTWFAGLAVSSLAPSVGFLYFSYGLIAGMGFNMITLASFVIVQQHFQKHRALAAGMSAAGISVGTLAGGPIVGFLVKSFGWRGALLILAGIAANCSVLGSFYRPVRQVQKWSPVKNLDVKVIDVAVTTQNTDKAKNVKDDGLKMVLLQLCKDMTNLSLFRNAAFTLCCFGTFFMNIGMTVFYQHTPKRAVFLGIDKERAILLPTAIGTSTLVARIFASFVGNLRCTNRTLQYGVSITIGGILLTVTGKVTEFSSIALLGAAIGFLGGCALTVQTTVLCDLVGVENVARAQAFVLVFTGVGALIAVPLAGWIFDKTDNYSIPFYTGGTVQMFGGILITVAAGLRKIRFKENVYSQGQSVR